MVTYCRFRSKTGTFILSPCSAECVVHCPWCGVRCPWSIVRGAWSIVRGAGCVVNSTWCGVQGRGALTSELAALACSVSYCHQTYQFSHYLPPTLSALTASDHGLWTMNYGPRTTTHPSLFLFLWTMDHGLQFIHHFPHTASPSANISFLPHSHIHP